MVLLMATPYFAEMNPFVVNCILVGLQYSNYKIISECREILYDIKYLWSDCITDLIHPYTKKATGNRPIAFENIMYKTFYFNKPSSFNCLIS